jgi:lambda repressor-like predicted transcriptional regulator
MNDIKDSYFEELRKQQRDPDWRMSPTELKEALEMIGWKGRELARRARFSQTTVKRWLDGQYLIPRRVAAGLITLAIAHETTALIEPLQRPKTIGLPNRLR